jgi:intracellular septation protein
MAFFGTMMLVNEAVWRTQSTDTWVGFKVFGFTGASLVFTFWIIFQLMQHVPHEDDKEEH